MSTVVFAGPSIFGIDRALMSGLQVRPPAAAGDLLAAVRSGARVVGLIDGVFANAPSVNHKEILYALQQGVVVLGAASLGALRACECSVFGMQGVGRIFEDYASGKRVSDADVALVYAPAELAFQPLSLPLVDVEATLRNALHKAEIDEAAAAALFNVAVGLHYSVRTWTLIIDNVAIDTAAREWLHLAISRSETSAKRDDAEALLRQIGEASATVPRWEGHVFAHTSFFEALERQVASRGCLGEADHG